MTERILIIVQNLPVPFDRRVWQEATSLRMAGFEVVVICPKKKTYTKGHETLEGVEIYRYPLPYEGDSALLGYLIEFSYCWIVTLALALWTYGRRPFHVIHACNPPDTYFALALLFRPLGVRFVFDHHDLCPEMYVAKGHLPRGLVYRTLLWLERCTFRSAHLVISVNQSHRDLAIKRGGLAPDSVVVVRSGPPRGWADINRVRPELKRGRSYLVLYLGEMCKQDGVDYLLRAIAHYCAEYGAEDTCFALVGGGPDQSRMRDMARQLGIQNATHFTGRIPDEELWAYLSTADICVDPDPLTEWSNLSTMNKMIEYMAFGRPIVAFDLLEHRNTATDAAIYVPGNNEKELAAKLRGLTADPDRRRQVGSSGRRRFREALAWEFSEKVLVESYRGLFARSAAPMNEREDRRQASLQPAAQSAASASTAILSTDREFLDAEYGYRPRTMRVLGLHLHCLTYDEMHAAFDWWISDKRRPALTVALVNVNCCVSALRDRKSFECYNAASLRGIDSMPFLRIARLLTRRRLDRLYAPDMLLEVARRAAAKEYRFFLLGGMPGACEVISQMLTCEFGATVVGTACPPFRPLTPLEDAELVDQINTARPDFVWVGLGSPKQDLWIQEHRNVLRGCVVVASGATFDFFSGRIRQAPKWIRDSGFEWLYRLSQDWRRLWRRYTVYNLVFAWALTLELLGIRRWEQPRGIERSA
jgi:exopolysaccharide biosynthesis WecB/TagA/CpsF family protein